MFGKYFLIVLLVGLGALLLVNSNKKDEQLMKDALQSRNGLQYLYRPAKTESAGGAPVIILMHGVGANEQDLFELAQRFDSRYAVISLRAPLVMGPMHFAWFHVNFTEQGPQHNKEEAEESRKVLVNFIKKINDVSVDIDPKQVYLMGFSQGTIMGLSLVLTEPELIKGFVAISGRTLQEISALSRERKYTVSPKILLIHGLQDSKLPYTHAQNTESVLKAAGLNYEFKSYPADHQITAGMLEDIQTFFQ
jgi:Predicted esterase